MGITVRCRCNVQRRIDPSQVGPWRLRCKQCGDVLYDPTQPSGQGRVPNRAPSDQGPVPSPPRAPSAPPRSRVSPLGGQDRPLLAPAAPLNDEDSTFQRWLEGSGELKVLLSSDGTSAPKCERHPKRRIVAACTRCSAFLCKFCLDRIDDEFVCSECVAKVAAKVDLGSGGLKSWFRKIFGKES